MHDDVTRPEGSMGVVVTLKSKMAASSANSGGNSKIIVSFDLSESSNKLPEPVLDGIATSEHMSALMVSSCCETGPRVRTFQGTGPRDSFHHVNCTGD